MRNIASKIKSYQLISPRAATTTVTGSGVQVTPNEDQDAVAIVNLGAVAGTPDSFTVDVVISQSATSGGSYTTKQTFHQATAGSQICHLPVLLDTAKPFVKAVATISFTGGTTPSIPIAVTLLVKQNNNSDSNSVALS